MGNHGNERPLADTLVLKRTTSACGPCRCGLDVFEDEPAMAEGLADCPNAVIVPHIASASMWTRSGMVGRGFCYLTP